MRKDRRVDTKHRGRSHALWPAVAGIFALEIAAWHAADKNAFYRERNMNRRMFLLTTLAAAMPAIAEAQTRRFRLRRKSPSGGVLGTTQAAAEWPIAKDVFTMAQQQILPIGLSAATPKVNPADAPLYEKYGYSAWRAGPGTNYSREPGHLQAHDKRTELAPGYASAPHAARLLSFFAISDIHITDKESPAQPIYPGWSALFGPSSHRLQAGSYSPVILSTTHVLDAAVQTINALHEKTPFDFGISLGDDCNNTQYNELRWFIDVLDGNVIIPSSGDHAGAETIDYQKPAATPTIPFRSSPRTSIPRSWRVRRRRSREGMPSASRGSSAPRRPRWPIRLPRPTMPSW
jgi:hypothetical protein